MNEWMNACMNEWMNEWIVECMHEWMKWQVNTHTQVFLSLWGHSIDVIVFILYKLYFLSPDLNPTLKSSWKLFLMHGGPKKGPHKVKIYWYDYPCWGYIWFPLRREYQVHTYTHTIYLILASRPWSNREFITSLVSVRLQLVSTFCNLKLQNVPFLSIMQLTLSKTEMGQIWSTSVLAEVIKSRFLSFEWYFNQLFPTFTYCINFDICLQVMIP